MSKYVSKKKGNKALVVALVIALLVLAAAIFWLISRKPVDRNDAPATQATNAPSTAVVEATFGTEGTVSATEEATEPASEAEPSENTPDISVEEVDAEVDYDLKIADFGSYTGVYMEDGSDEFVVGVLMIMVTNESELPLQYAEIVLTVGEEKAYFSVSTLPAGSSAVLLEKNRMSYEDGMSISRTDVKNAAFFDGPLSLSEDKIQIQALDGAMNIINVSGEDISGDIVIYYKNSSSDMFYGGITYRVRLEGGMKKDEIKQIMSAHFSGSGSTILLVTCG